MINDACRCLSLLDQFDFCLSMLDRFDFCRNAEVAAFLHFLLPSYTGCVGWEVSKCTVDGSQPKANRSSPERVDFFSARSIWIFSGFFPRTLGSSYGRRISLSFIGFFVLKSGEKDLPSKLVDRCNQSPRDRNARRGFRLIILRLCLLCPCLAQNGASTSEQLRRV